MQRLVSSRIYIVELAHKAEIQRMVIVYFVAEIRFPKPLINGKRQPCSRCFFHSFIIPVIIMVITEREISR
ncbi:unknown [Bacteroides intestinalis CAG:315]|nr:unknown [Bacteroides intestinalis CAG:315]